jgi:hypothetical protein
MSDINIYADQTAIDALTPITGDVVLRASDNAVLLYNGSAWKEFQPDAGPAFANDYSLSLDGTDDYASFSAISLPDGPRTISAWFKASSLVSGYKGLIGGTSHYLGVNPSSNNFLIYDGTSPRYKQWTGTISTSSWVHVMVVDNDSGAQGNCVFYVNGSDIGIPGPNYNTSAPAALTFSYLGRKSNDYFPGLIDEVAIWNSDESANISEIRDTSGSNPVPGDLSLMTNQPLHWWRMGDNDSGTGSTITDQGSAGVDATLQNQASFSSDVPS